MLVLTTTGHARPHNNENLVCCASGDGRDGACAGPTRRRCAHFVARLAQRPKRGQRGHSESPLWPTTLGTTVTLSVGREPKQRSDYSACVRAYSYSVVRLGLFILVKCHCLIALSRWTPACLSASHCIRLLSATVASYRTLGQVVFTCRRMQFNVHIMCYINYTCI